jgi:hypothetical protein
VVVLKLLRHFHEFLKRVAYFEDLGERLEITTYGDSDHFYEDEC